MKTFPLVAVTRTGAVVVVGETVEVADGTAAARTELDEAVADETATTGAEAAVGVGKLTCIAPQA